MRRLKSAIEIQREFRSPALEHKNDIVPVINAGFLRSYDLIYPASYSNQHGSALVQMTAYHNALPVGKPAVAEGEVIDSPLQFSIREPLDEFGMSATQFTTRRAMRGGMCLLRNLGVL